MIILKTHSQIQALRDAGRIAAIAREAGGEQCREGVTTAHIDAVIRKTILSHGATPSFLHLYGFPGSACISSSRYSFLLSRSSISIRFPSIVRLRVLK